MSLSSTGIGSQLPVEEIVSKLVALEKKPLASLTQAASSMQTQLSTFSQVKSLMSTLSDTAAKLAKNITLSDYVYIGSAGPYTLHYAFSLNGFKPSHVYYVYNKNQQP